MAQYGDQLEMIFVSSDRDIEAFAEYHGEMTFCALPFEERAAKQQLSKRFGIQGIPSLLILGPKDKATGERPLINDNLLDNKNKLEVIAKISWQNSLRAIILQ